jgi:hypothetical protein
MAATWRRRNAPQLADDAMQKHRCEGARSPAMAKQPGLGSSGLNSAGGDLLEGEGGFSTLAMRIRGDGGAHGGFIQTTAQEAVEASGRATVNTAELSLHGGTNHKAQAQW